MPIAKKSAKKAVKMSASPKVDQKSKATALLVGLTYVDSTCYTDERGRPWDGRVGCWGCDDDVAAMSRLLEREGYSVTVLLDEAAKRKAVIAALRSAATKTKAGETFFFYYSGHGGRIKDQPAGTPGNDEIDGWDETLCLFDGDLRDDDLNDAWIAFPKGAAIFVLSDCCHSGTNYRALGRPVPQPVDFVRDLNGDARMKASLLHISGCKDEQLSAGEEDGGAFTTVVTRLWDRGRFQGTWDTFHDAVAAELPGSQRPQGNLYGPGSDKLAARRPFAPL